MDYIQGTQKHSKMAAVQDQSAKIAAYLKDMKADFMKEIEALKAAVEAQKTTIEALKTDIKSQTRRADMLEDSLKLIKEISNSQRAEVKSELEKLATQAAGPAKPKKGKTAAAAGGVEIPAEFKSTVTYTKYKWKTDEAFRTMFDPDNTKRNAIIQDFKTKGKDFEKEVKEAAAKGHGGDARAELQAKTIGSKFSAEEKKKVKEMLTEEKKKLMTKPATAPGGPIIPAVPVTVGAAAAVSQQVKAADLNAILAGGLDGFTQ